MTTVNTTIEKLTDFISELKTAHDKIADCDKRLNALQNADQCTNYSNQARPANQRVDCLVKLCDINGEQIPVPVKFAIEYYTDLKAKYEKIIEDSCKLVDTIVK